MGERIALTGSGIVSPVGYGEMSQKNWFSGKTAIVKRKVDTGDFWCAPLDEISEQKIQALAGEEAVYNKLDRSVLMAMEASRQACAQAGWEKGSDFGINLASSRGTTELLEAYHSTFLEHPMARLAPMASPSTTTGNVSSWVGQDLEAKGIVFSHSITCSSSLHAIANAMAWIKSGMAQRFLAGGAEAPLTAFTVAQMRGLQIYAGESRDTFPCRPFNGTGNSMVLGEGAAVFCLEKERPGLNALAYIGGLGYGTEKVSRAGAISANGDCLQHSMRMALEHFGKKIDLVIAHAPGTLKGDQAELNAIRSVFGESHPAVYASKWQTGHTLGASGTLSMTLAIAILKQQQVPLMPFGTPGKGVKGSIKSILVNAVGFGGNAVSVILENA